MSNLHYFRKSESFVSKDLASSAISKSGHGRSAFVTKVVGYDGLNFQRKVLPKSIQSNYQFLKFTMDGDGLYEVMHFCSSRINGMVWDAYILIDGGEVKQVTNQEALLISQSIEKQSC